MDADPTATAMYIEGFGINNFRSFGKDVQRFGPFQKINLFAGQNNAGKSNVLRWIHLHFRTAIDALKSGSGLKFDQIDAHIGADAVIRRIEIPIKVGGPSHKMTIKRCEERHALDAQETGNIEKILRSRTLSNGSELAWFPYSTQPAWALDRKAIVQPLIDENVLSEWEWRNLWSKICARSGGSIQEHWIPELLKFLSPVNLEFAQVHFIPAVRTIEGTKPIEGFDANTIIDQLARLQNPPHNAQHKRVGFARVTEFLREVTGNGSATLEIPYERNTISVDMDGRTLPLEALGTGIHEVIILAAAATVVENRVFCIEEPEIHLHPILQRKLLRYLLEKTSNQYFLSTHSASFMDIPGSAVFHVRQVNGASAITNVIDGSTRSSVCVDLGYLASDLVQANCIIWVEGPSDRVYLKHWLSSLAPDLREGINYSIMFYGGRLLSHLSAEDPEVTEFISLRRLNRNLAILMDSDKSGPNAKINATKTRIKEEFDANQGFAWVTKGREIENYIPAANMEEAIKTLCKDAGKSKSPGAFEVAYTYVDLQGRPKDDVDKVKLAREIIKSGPSLKSMDLERQLQKLIAFIRKANLEEAVKAADLPGDTPKS